MPSPLVEVLQRLRSNGFREIAGSRLSADIPVSERLLNEIVAATLPRDLPVREASVKPEAGNRLTVRVTPRTAFLPPLTLKLEIERQPDVPSSFVLVLKMAPLPGIFGLATALPLDRILPPGVRLEGDRILVDLRALLGRLGLADLLPHARALRVTTEAGKVLVHLDIAVPAT